MIEIYSCPACGHESDEPVSRCPACGRWHEGDLESRSEEDLEYAEVGRHGEPAVSAERAVAGEIQQVARFSSGMGELDRVLGGGIHAGSCILVAGPPGVGKSSLLMKAASLVAATHGPVLYLSAEESLYQAAERAQRIGAAHPDLFILADSVVEAAFAEARRLSAALVVVDSLQLVRTSFLEAPPGGASQVKEVSMRMVDVAKRTGTPFLVSGQIVKSGEFAGPMSVPHLFDAFLRLDPVTLPGFLLLRSEKNRFGSTAEVGVLKLTPRGIAEAPHPSSEILARGVGIVAVVLEGTRPIATPVQAVFLQRADLSASSVGYPRERLHLIRAILDGEGVHVPKTLAVDIVGGYRVTDPAADLAVVLAAAFASSARPLPTGWGAIGEVDLAGRVLPPREFVGRFQEALAVEVPDVLVPRTGSDSLPPSERTRVHPVATVAEALREIGFRKASVRREAPPESAPSTTKKKTKTKKKKPRVRSAPKKKPLK